MESHKTVYFTVRRRFGLLLSSCGEPQNRVFYGASAFWALVELLWRATKPWKKRENMRKRNVLSVQEPACPRAGGRSPNLEICACQKPSWKPYRNRLLLARFGQIAWGTPQEGRKGNGKGLGPGFSTAPSCSAGRRINFAAFLRCFRLRGAKNRVFYGGPAFWALVEHLSSCGEPQNRVFYGAPAFRALVDRLWRATKPCILRCAGVLGSC